MTVLKEHMIKLMRCMRELALSRSGRNIVIDTLANTSDEKLLAIMDHYIALLMESQTEEEFLRKLETE